MSMITIAVFSSLVVVSVLAVVRLVWAVLSPRVFDLRRYFASAVYVCAGWLTFIGGTGDWELSQKASFVALVIVSLLVAAALNFETN